MAISRGSASLRAQAAHFAPDPSGLRFGRGPPRRWRTGRPPALSAEKHLAPLGVGALGDDGVGHSQDGRPRSVILLELDDPRPGEVAVEVEDVSHLGAAPAVNGLIVVADRADVHALAAEQAKHLELGAIGVLVLVDEHVEELALPAGTHVGVDRERGARPRRRDRRSRRPGTGGAPI